MKILLTTFLLCCIHAAAFTQVKFSYTSFDAAIKAAAEAGKLIMLQYEADYCEQCNEVGDKAFGTKELGEKINPVFICIKITAGHPDRLRIASLYDRNRDAFGTMFIASDRTLLHSYPGSSSQAETYIKESDKALFKASEGMRLSTMLREYEKNEGNLRLLEEILYLKQELNLDTDSLLNVYAGYLPKDSATSIPTIVFMAKMAPVIDSRPDVMMRRSPVFYKAWNTLPLKERVKINHLIVYKSMNKAIREKDDKYAYRVAAYRKFTYDHDQMAGQKAADNQLLRYFLQTKDTLNYLIRSVYYYDQYYMTVSVDSIKQKDSLDFASQARQSPMEKTEKPGTFKQTLRFTPSAQNYARELNNAADAVYTLTSDPLLLAKALTWSARANEFFEHYIHMNTHAQVLYKAGKKEEAITWQQKAIDTKKKMGYKTQKLEMELAAMKAGKPLPVQ